MTTSSLRAEPTAAQSPSGPYEIEIAEADLAFRKIRLRSANPTGREILASGGFEAGGDVALFAILTDGNFEDIRLDEAFEIHRAGVERFVAFQSDRSFRLMISGAQIDWGKPTISGKVLAQLAVASGTQGVFLAIADGDDRIVNPSELVDLTKAGVERFYVADVDVTTLIKVNGRGRSVPGIEVTFEQIVQIAFPNDTTPNAVFSMTYRHAASQPHAGDLAVGGVVHVKEGTVFNVTRTVQS
ncbi:multiubiquitin domain-containing protein [Sphingomonas sp. PB4P5]|uniref:multiubiquitin domain-containing protein n=1 Tax=Parasphingomonas puruogangriensis TaxID=3096155 RepID=UPI002FCA6356